MTDAELHLFVSDVHLCPGGDATTERFVAFLESVEGKARALHVLGDLFHYWLGRGHERRADYQGVLRAFRRVASSGVEVNFIWGNRDFLVAGASFERIAGVRLRGDAHTVSIGPRRVELVHGDLLCKNDERYQRYRKVIRSRPMQALARVLSLDLKRGLAEALRRLSQREVGRKPMAIMDLDQRAVEELFTGGAELAVCGHIHREQRRPVTLGDRRAELFVLGSWDHDGPFLAIDAAGRWAFGRERVGPGLFDGERSGRLGGGS
jgi:UDP-2,3-diacylglucosamine hydrolase